MNTVIIAVFALVAVLHLAAAFLEIQPLRKVTKIFLVPLLLLYYCLNTRTFLVPVLLAAVFGWLGDCCLIKISDKRFFIAGLFSFLLGHIFYIPSMLFFTGSVNILWLVVSVLAGIAFGIVTIKTVKPDKPMLVPAIAYVVVILLMSITALQLLLFRKDFAAAVIFAGSLCFMISDYILARFTFSSLPKRGNFYIMLPYILAQTCILYGLSLC
ncbi:lysoplasmalogenase [Brucepastera parasyntrophica]|uniref:lysoplasmalogenase n=1 Tax=Brucepastera parasyntrophica TaxID=2880008 RepID=UPI00210B78CD|nr:lysoplasmalogenase [Brucepastera parasyntrophica]ULQ59457.1 lysoplasmalogenase [Brucepastera parasyntrophica]